MNRTTGAELTALSIAALTSVDKNREAIGENLGCVNLEANVDGRAAVCRNACLILRLACCAWRREEESAAYRRQRPCEHLGSHCV